MVFTSESVSEGHPDKICDQISDAVLDAALTVDSNARVACESMISTGLIVVGGEISTTAYIDLRSIVQQVFANIGIHGENSGINPKTCSILNVINTQSPDIARGILHGGAGDQGHVFGYACDETEEFMPLPPFLAHQLLKRLSFLRHSEAPFLQPDAKSQVSVTYQNGTPKYIHSIIISTQHDKTIALDKVRKYVEDNVIVPVIPANMTKNMKILVNPAGPFVLGGPIADCGLTGRKIIVDTYGGFSRHGGGAFSGKDPTKVDRSAAYIARYIAKNIVAAKLCNICELQISYAIGIPQPIAIHVKAMDKQYRVLEPVSTALSNFISLYFDLTPRGIIKHLNLLNPIYLKTSTYGHFGKPEFSWEKLNHVETLKKFFNKTSASQTIKERSTSIEVLP